MTPFERGAMAMREAAAKVAETMIEEALVEGGDVAPTDARKIADVACAFIRAIPVRANDVGAQTEIISHD